MASNRKNRAAPRLANFSDEMIYRWRVWPERRMEYLSPAALRILGRPEEDFYADAHLTLKLVLEEDRPVLQSLMDDPGERVAPVIVRWRHANGSIVWTELIRTPIRNKAGRIVAVEGIVRDVTREKSLERERDAHAALLAALIANMQDAVMAEDEGGRITVANAAFCRLCGESGPDAIIGAEAEVMFDRVWPRLVADPEMYRSMLRELRASQTPQVGFEVILLDGRIFDRDYVPVPGPGGTIVHMWHYRDVTHRRRTEQRLRVSRQRLRELSAHIERAREEERRHLARTLHDELGQLFSSIRLELGAAIAQFRAMPAPAMRPVVDRLQAAAGLTDVGVASLRSLTTALRPPVLDHLGLIAAIRWEASIFSKRTGIRCHVRARPAMLEPDAAHVTALYRILLAALDNIARHAAAGTVWIYLTRQRGLTLMEVRDNGRGITEAQVNNPRTMGLLSMRERAVALGGDLRITGARGKGTRVLVMLPGKAAAELARPRQATMSGRA